MADVVWEDLNCRARKIEGGYESVLNWDGEELIVNYFPFDVMAVILEEDGRKPTPEEVEETARMWADDPMVALDALPPVPPRVQDEAEIADNWERVRKSLGMPDVEEVMAEIRKEMEIRKEREKEGINSSFKESRLRVVKSGKSLK